jgi:hypothetical protein
MAGLEAAGVMRKDGEAGVEVSDLESNLSEEVPVSVNLTLSKIR